MMKRASRFFSKELVPKLLQKPATRSNAIFSEGWVTKLVNRSVISVRGRDSTALLHNIST
jgi:hypothetical protein